MSAPPTIPPQGALFLKEAAVVCGVNPSNQPVSLRATAEGLLSTASQPAQFTNTPDFTIKTANGTVFTLAAGEIGYIQNLDSADALAVKLGANASATSLNRVLCCGAAQDDGTGGEWLIENHVGAVSVYSITGTARYVAWKRST